MRLLAAVPVVMFALLGAAKPPAVPLRLAPAQQDLAPGRTTAVGVVLTLPEGWHTYWDGLNDSGYPPRIVWELPTGITVGAPAWPAPQRHVAAGEILDHVLAGEVVAVVALTTAVDLAPGTRVVLRCRVEWLACRDICVPGRSDASLDLAVVAPDAVREDPAGARLLGAARTRLPRPLPAAGPVRWQRDANILTIEAPGARSLVLMPRSDSARPVDLLHQGLAEGDRLQIALRPEDAGRFVHGVLAVDAVTNWQIDIPPEDP